MKIVQIDGENLRLEDVKEVSLKRANVKISKKAITRIKKCRKYVEEVIRCGETVYGINTGVGKLCRVKIKADEIEKLQRNLILSHAVSFGPIFTQEEVSLVGVQSGSEKYHSNRLKTVSDTAEGTTVRALLTPKHQTKSQISPKNRLGTIRFVTCSSLDGRPQAGCVLANGMGLNSNVMFIKIGALCRVQPKVVKYQHLVDIVFVFGRAALLPGNKFTNNNIFSPGTPNFERFQPWCINQLTDTTLKGVPVAIVHRERH